MNSIAIIIILMISLIGIGSIFWIRTYYNVNTRTVDTVLLKKSVTNILTSNPEDEEYESLTYSYPSLEGESENKGNSNTFNIISGSGISAGIKKIFNNDNTEESRLQSLKTAINDTIKKEDTTPNTVTPITESDNSITPTFTSYGEESEVEEIVPYTQDSEIESSVEKPPIFPKAEEETVKVEEVKKEAEDAETDEKDNGVIYTEHAIENKMFVSPEDEVQKAIKSSEPDEADDSGVITPIHTNENREILELYDDNETMTPYENFEYKDSDQRKIENASNKIDKFYERLSEISINKITGKNKETDTAEDQTLNKNESNYTQTVFKTESDNKLSNETIVPFDHEVSISDSDDDTITPVTSPRRTLDGRGGLKIKVKINNMDVELKSGDTIIFNYNNESYSSIIIDVRPDEVYVNYRRHRVWISPDTIKKKLE